MQLAGLFDEMSAIPCAPKTARGNSNVGDRLSSLPDEMLHHMMSFLPMPEVVRTSLLSPRWRNLWAATPFIHLDKQDFSIERQHFRDPVDEEKMEKFGNKLLLLRDPTVCLDEARIVILTDPNTIKSDEWVWYAIKHEVRLLHVSGLDPVPRRSTPMFPSHHVKIIRLQRVRLYGKDFRPLNDDCPVLERLELEECNLYEVKEISSRSLKVLHMILCYNDEDLLICARNLTHLSINNPTCKAAIVTRDLSFLVTASVFLSSAGLHFCLDIIVDDHRLLDGLSHATTLKLDAPSHELALESSLRTCPMFSNLTTLELGDWCTVADFYPLLRILRRSPKLKELIFELDMEECSECKLSGSALLSSGETSSITGSYPSIERIKICCCCCKDDPRVGALVQVLLPIIIPDGKICIERC